ncbi:histidinol-phosphate aminotransferase [Mariprofundus ferrinatatus]|uniref:Histidinol-phosphate aminotransferase n=1 Tax=Mariprofundus ferrinatatus TaxID=1921087 RepID=A0A2K8L2B6_9PROT|nr:histidinol-phosphate transaminase [Mariprofundus ferrinatatus]ATX81242.1 histidinol-phosphate aminotransferase [Mariprofundus ferrinatatus]
MIRNDIKALSAYHVPDSSGMIKLDAMENPFSMPDDLRKQWAEKLAGVDINRYPDADMYKLRAKIASHEGVEPEQVLLGNGSDEIIQMILIATVPGTCVIPSPTFVMYNLVSQWLKRPVATVPLAEDFTMKEEHFLQVCAREKAVVAFLACPNNPTGNLWRQDKVEMIARGMSGMLVIDEAYGPFSERTHNHLIGPNVMVLKTFSKVGWAGLRMGYLLGDAEVIAQLNKVRMPYNINALTQASATFLLDHFDVFEKQVAELRDERERMAAALADMKGIEIFPSQANFLLVRVENSNAVFESLRQAGILIKNMHGSDRLLDNCLRITVGSHEENDAVLAAMRGIVA